MSLFTSLDVKVGKILIQTSIHTPIQDDFITNVHDVINRQQMQLISHYQCVSVVCVVQQLERGGFFSESISKSALFPSIHDAVLHCLCLSERDQSRSEFTLVRLITLNTHRVSQHPAHSCELLFFYRKCPALPDCDQQESVCPRS